MERGERKWLGGRRRGWEGTRSGELGCWGGAFGEVEVMKEGGEVVRVNGEGRASDMNRWRDELDWINFLGVFTPPESLGVN